LHLQLPYHYLLQPAISPPDSACHITTWGTWWGLRSSATPSIKRPETQRLWGTSITRATEKPLALTGRTPSSSPNFVNQQSSVKHVHTIWMCCVIISHKYSTSLSITIGLPPTSLQHRRVRDVVFPLQLLPAWNLHAQPWCTARTHLYQQVSHQ
jgi:hypothetical protein